MSGPSPTISSRAGISRRIRENSSITAGTRLTGRKFDTWITTFSSSREKRGPRVRDGVVRVDDVEPLVARDLHDLRRQRQQILRLAEQGIRRRLDAMERQPRLIVAEPERRVAAEDVHAMAARGQRLPQL